MNEWRNEYRTCACGETFKPKREAQRHCSAACRDIAKKREKRGQATDLPRSGDTPASDAPGGFVEGPTMVWPGRDFHHGPTPGALQGDDYPLEYYEDGYPRLPACLDRRRKPESLAEAA